MTSTAVPTAGAVRAGGSGQAAGADQSLQAVSPGNGDSVAVVPDTVTLTFATSADDVVVQVRGPDGQVVDGTERVDGGEVEAGVPQAGAGDYVVSYRDGDLRGETGFTVLAPGEAPPADPSAGAGSTVVSLVLAAALLAVVALTVRRWLTRGGGGR